MLEKIQSISTNLDKKRVYTAVGALVVALATGHVMQRTVNQQNEPVDMRAQQAQVTPAATTGRPDVAEVAEATPEPLPIPDTQPAGEEVTKGDTAPATDPIAPRPSAEMAAEIDGPAAIEPEAVAAEQVEPAQSADWVATTTDPAQTEWVAPDADPVELAEVSRSVSTDTLPRPALDASEFDLTPADVVTTPEETDAVAEDCAPNLALAPLPGALIYAELTSPCDAGAEVEFDHAGLKFTESLDDEGMLTVMVPAMTGDAAVSAMIEGHDDPVEASLVIEDVNDYDRIALVWQGGTGLQLHALENGAYYGEAGHVWAEEPGLPARATDGQGGFVTVLGSTTGGYAADVYTYPLSMPTAPAISIEAQVLETTCAHAIVGEYLRSVPDGEPTATQVGMIVPDCEAVGEYLVLKNLPQDLTIARN
ncbi:MAG: hypothetical protein VX874_04445 [Pseudomonadota bacterium]|nr:hypothetical protein [Pseudomonadota bacterium]